jgi:deoxyribonuclease V
MLAALDAHYDDATLLGTGAAVIFRHWEDCAPLAEYTAICNDIQPYVPGDFFKRELPCLLAVLEKVQEPLKLIIVDGYVILGSKPGLGLRLWEALGKKTPIIGVAKTRYQSASAIEIKRGQSKTPLYVTAAGVNPIEAAEDIARMAGAFRIPTLLKRVDQLTRGPSARK